MFSLNRAINIKKKKLLYISLYFSYELIHLADWKRISRTNYIFNVDFVGSSVNNKTIILEVPLK